MKVEKLVSEVFWYRVSIRSRGRYAAASCSSHRIRKPEFRKGPCMKPTSTVLLLCFLLMLGYSQQVAAQDEQFYNGKSIKVVVGFTSGGFYDRWSRLLVRHVPKYLPGNPEIIVQNMPGAASMIAANHLANVTKPDGLTIGALYEESEV